MKKKEKMDFSWILATQICEQIIEKKNSKGIEYSIFFSHTASV